jgi:hypothetical protein
MDQVSYRGYARSIGFDPIKAPTEGLSRMQERDDRVIRNMEENRRAIKEVRDDYSRGLERKLSIESQDRDRNYLYEKSLDENRQKFVEKNANTVVQNELQRSKNIMATYESLAKFSTTLAGVVTEYKKNQDEKQKAEATFKVASGEISSQQIKDAQNILTLGKMAGKANDTIVAEMQKAGASPYLISSLMSSNPMRKVAIIEQHASQAFDTRWSSWSLNKLNELGLTTAEQRAAAAPDLLQKFMKEEGIGWVDPMTLLKPLQKGNSIYAGHVESARKSDIRNKSDDIRSQEIRNLVTVKTGEQFMTSLSSIALTYGEDATTPLNLKGARDELYRVLKDPSLFSDQDVESILSNAQTDQGSMKDRFPAEYDELMEQRRSESNQEAAQIEAQQARENKVKEEKLLKWVEENNPGEDELNSIINKAAFAGIQTDRLKAALAFTTERQNQDFWNKLFRDQEEAGTLSAEDINKPGVPIEVRETWLTRAQRLDQARSDSGISQEVIKAELSDALKQKLIGDSTTKSAHYSLRSASDYALRLYNQKFKQYSINMEPAKAAEKARLDVITAIEKGTGRFLLTNAGKAAGSQAFYNSFTPGNHPGAPKNVSTVTDVSATIAKVRRDNSKVSTEVLTSPGILKSIDNQIRDGKPISIPTLYRQLSRAIPGMTPVDILNAQLKAAGLTSQVKPGALDTLDRTTTDPVLKNLLSRNPITQDNINAAIVGSGNAPATVRTGNSGYTDVQALGSAAGFKFPQVMAAMWALESGWGKYTSGKNNVFNIKARPGQGTQKNGSYWRDYASPLESAKDFMNLMTDPRYAPGLAVAKTPRQAIEAIAGAGYAGGEAEYPGKIIRVMQQMGVNVDQPYRPAPPARNTNYMSKTLAYITDGIMPEGKYSEHLDIKQQDNPATAVNERHSYFKDNALDGFVEFNDPEFGQITLSELRKRIPIEGGGFYDMREGGTRQHAGYDYGTKAGTKLYLKNGARVVSKSQTPWGSMVIIQLPDGRRFSFLHGKSV